MKHNIYIVVSSDPEYPPYPVPVQRIGTFVTPEHLFFTVNKLKN